MLTPPPRRSREVPHNAETLYRACDQVPSTPAYFMDPFRPDRSIGLYQTFSCNAIRAWWEDAPVFWTTANQLLHLSRHSYRTAYGPYRPDPRDTYTERIDSYESEDEPWEENEDDRDPDEETDF